MQKRIAIGLMCILLFGGLFSVINPKPLDAITEGRQISQSTSMNTEFNEKVQYSLSYEPHDQIFITDDGDWIGKGFPGAGTAESPYLIENLEIISDYNCIYIIYTSKYYIIRNCFLHSNSMRGEGIHINHADHGRVENCTIVMKNEGISVLETSGLMVANNTLYNLGNYGINFYSSSNCIIIQNEIYNTSGRSIRCSTTSCRIEGNTVSNSSGEALYMYNCNSGEILLNTFQDSFVGSYLESCSSIIITNNSVLNNHDAGFMTYGSDDLIFINNTISNNDGYGVLWQASDNATIKSNRISNSSYYGFYLTSSNICNLTSNVFTADGLVISGSQIPNWLHAINNNFVNGKRLGYFVNQHDLVLDGSTFGQIIIINSTWITIQGGSIGPTDVGIGLFFSSNCTVNSSLITKSMIGIHLLSSQSCNVTNTILSECSIFIQGTLLSFWVHNIMGSFINGRPVGYFFEEAGLNLDDDTFGQIIVVNSTDITIRDYAISNTSNALAFAFSSNCVVNNSRLNDNFVGVQLQNCVDFTFERITINDSINSAAIVYSSDNCTFSNITIIHSVYAIYLSSCTRCTINEGRFVENSYGIYAKYSDLLNVSNSVFERNYEAFRSFYLDTCTITNCQVVNSTDYGFLLDHSNHIILRECSIMNNENDGVFLYYSHYGLISNNTIKQNKNNGLYLFGSDYNQILNNTVANNTGYGIDIHVWSDYNTMISNYISDNILGNGYGYQSTNAWDDGLATGNFWSDHSGLGPYYIDGPGNNIDHHPIVPGVVLILQDDLEFHFNETSALITWQAFSSKADKLIIYKNGDIVNSSTWNGFDVTIKVETGTLGLFNYTIFLNSTNGEFKTDTVMVTIYDLVPIIDSPYDCAFNFDTTGNYIHWSPSDRNPNLYEVYRNDTLILSDLWSGSQVYVCVDGLQIGVYNYTLRVIDTGGNTACDSIVVTIYDTPPVLNTPPSDISYDVGSQPRWIFWDVSDANPANCTIFRNGSIITTNLWYGDPITISTSGLAEGVYNYTLVVVDTSGLSLIDCVIVTVTPASITTSATTTTTTTTDTTFTSSTPTTPAVFTLTTEIIIAIGLGAVALVLISIILKYRK